MPTSDRLDLLGFAFGRGVDLGNGVLGRILALMFACLALMDAPRKNIFGIEGLTKFSIHYLGGGPRRTAHRGRARDMRTAAAQLQPQGHDATTSL